MTGISVRHLVEVPIFHKKTTIFDHIMTLKEDVIRTHPLKIINVCTKLHGNFSSYIWNTFLFLKIKEEINVKENTEVKKNNRRREWLDMEMNDRDRKKEKRWLTGAEADLTTGYHGMTGEKRRGDRGQTGTGNRWR